MRIFILSLLLGLLLGAQIADAQGLHFSQYNNAPLLLSPANTGLLPGDNFRAGAIYRNQWGQIPVPYHTFSAFADFQLLHNYGQTNWLGIGMAYFSDKAGTGDLALTKAEVTVAYHLQMGNYNMLSIGMSFAYAQRSIDFSKLTFDAQWDGFTFDQTLPSQENYTFQRANYADISTGINYAFFPNDNVYFRLGLSVLHINQPKVSFYGGENRVGMRPIAHADVIFQLSNGWIAEVSGYYTQQDKAAELLYGTQFSYNVTSFEDNPNVFIFGIYQRLNDAIIPVVGFEWNNIQIMGSMDITTSDLTPANKGNGAIELSIIYKGLYERNKGKSISGYNCPRF